MPSQPQSPPLSSQPQFPSSPTPAFSPNLLHSHPKSGSCPLCIQSGFLFPGAWGKWGREWGEGMSLTEQERHFPCFNSGSRAETQTWPGPEQLGTAIAGSVLQGPLQLQLEHAQCRWNLWGINLPLSNKSTEHVLIVTFQRLISWLNLGRVLQGWQKAHPCHKGLPPAKFQLPAPNH